MRRAARVALVFGAALIACASVSIPKEREQVITSPLLDNALDFLYFAVARTAHLEAWFCLKGFIDPRNGNAVLQTISPIQVDSADGANIHGHPEGCRSGGDSASVIGTIHFHPDMNECAFSDVDIVTAHWLPYPIEAIVCREDADTVPHVMAVFRRQIDSAYNAIQRQGGNNTPTEPRTFTPVYRYVRHPRPAR